MTPICMFDGSGHIKEYLIFDHSTRMVVTTPVSPPKTEYLQTSGGNVDGPIVFSPILSIDYNPKNLEIVNEDYVISKLADFEEETNNTLCSINGGSTVKKDILVEDTDPNNLTVISKHYADSKIGEYVRLVGDKMSGVLTLHSSEISEFEATEFDNRKLLAVPRTYVDYVVDQLRTGLSTSIEDYVVSTLTSHLTLDCCYPLTDNTVVSVKWVKKFIDCVFESLSDLPEIVLSQNLDVPTGVLVNGVLSANCKLVYHNMCGGSSEGRNYPLSFVVDYEGVPGVGETSGEAHTYAQNVFYLACKVEEQDEVRTTEELEAYQASVRSKIGYEYNHILALQDSWFKFVVDLINIRPRPSKITKISIRGAGCSTEVQIADISLKARMAVGGESPPTANVLLRHTASGHERNYDISKSVSAMLYADIRVLAQEFGCPLSILIRYHCSSGFRKHQQNFSIDGPCVATGGSRTVTRGEWVRVSFDLKKLDATVIEDVSIIGSGIEIDAEVKNLMIDVCKMEGGQAYVPRVPGNAMIPAQAAVAETPGVPGVPGTTATPKMWIKTKSVTSYNGNGPFPLTIADLRTKFVVNASDPATCPVVVEVSYKSTDFETYTTHVAYGPQNSRSHFTTFIQEIGAYQQQQDITVNLLDVAIPPIMEITSLRFITVGRNISVDVSAIQVMVSPATTDWTLYQHKLYKNLGKVTRTRALEMAQAEGATLVCIETQEQDNWVRSHFDHSIWLGAEGSLATGWSWSNGAKFSYSNFGSWVLQEGLSSHPTMHPTGSWVLMDDTKEAYAIVEKTSLSAGDVSKPVILSPNFSNIGDIYKDYWEFVNDPATTSISHNQIPNPEFCTVSMVREDVALPPNTTTIRQKINKNGIDPTTHVNLRADIRIINQMGGCPLTFTINYVGGYGEDTYSKSYGYNDCGGSEIVEKDKFVSIGFTVPGGIETIKNLEISASGTEYEALVGNLVLESGADCLEIGGTVPEPLSEYATDIVFIISNNGIMASHDHMSRTSYPSDTKGKDIVLGIARDFANEVNSRGQRDAFRIAVVGTCGGGSGFQTDVNAFKSTVEGLSFSSSTPGDVNGAFEQAFGLLNGPNSRQLQGAKKLIVTIMNNSISAGPISYFDVGSNIDAFKDRYGLSVMSVDLNIEFPFSEAHAITSWLDYGEGYWTTQEYNDYAETHSGFTLWHKDLPRPNYKTPCTKLFPASSFDNSGAAIYDSLMEVIDSHISNSCTDFGATDCGTVLSNGDFNSLSGWDTTSGDDGGSVSVVDRGKKYLRLFHGPQTGDIEEIGPIPAVPPKPGVPYKPMVPAVPAIAAIPAIDPEKVCGSIVSDVVYDSLWTEIVNTGVHVSYPTVGQDQVLKLEYSGNSILPEVKEYDLIRTGGLDGNYSGWDIEKVSGEITFKESDFERSCEEITKSSSTVLNLKLNDCGCDDAGIEDTCT